MTVDASADYKYRLVLSKKQAAKAITDYIMQTLTYDNFKAAQDPEPDGKRIDFLHRVWNAGYALQK